MGVKFTITEMLKQIDNFKKEIQENILQIPDNKNIKRLNSNPNCFVISSKDLGNNWSPEHHDNLYQAKILQEIIEGCDSLPALQNHLEIIVKTGRCQHNNYRWLTFNNEVRDFIKQLM